MKISAEKTKLHVIKNSANRIQREVKIKGQKLGAVVSDGGSTPRVFSMIAQATAALTKLKPVWKVTIYHWLGAYRSNALYSGHIFVRFNDLEDVFT